MFSIANMKVGTRLAAGFGVVLLALLGIAALGGMNATSGISFVRVMNENNRETVALSGAESTVWALRWGVAQFIAVTDANERKQIVDNQPELQKKFDDAVRLYQGGARTAEERAVLKDLTDAFGKYLGARSKWLELYSAGKTDEAARIRAEDLTPAGAATNKALGTLIDLQQKSAAAQGQDTVAKMTHGRILLISLSGLALLAAMVLAWFLARSITRPLGGELDVATEVARRISAGDLTVEVPVRPGDTTSLMAGMAGMRGNLSDIIARINDATDLITTASREIAAGNEDLSQRTEQQASSLEETASSMEELTSTVLQNAENAKQANQLAAGASEVAVTGGKVIGEVVQTMNSINESSKKIVDIISVIDGIAFQTNILALNAAVEAARAGEQGRGFAVVAAEVRTLAQRSAAAAKEIKQLIGDSVHKVENGTKLVDEAGKTMEQIVTSVKRVTDIMSEIAAASQEQSSGIEEVNQAITQMDQVTQQNAALVEEASAAAESMKQQAQHLVQAVAVFKLAEGAQHLAEPVRDARLEAPRPRAIAAQAPARKAIGAGGAAAAHNVPKERRLRLAQAPVRTSATHGGALAEKPENDQWTEL
jgi:methyl-accepting chemotaxis protein